VSRHSTGAAPQPTAQEVRFTVPGVPPDVNHYVRHTRNGRHYVTREALKFKADVALCAAKQYVAAKEYEVELFIYLGHKQRGDIDGFPKLCLDGLVEAGVIHTDSAIVKLTIEKSRDWKEPRTEFIVRAK